MKLRFIRKAFVSLNDDALMRRLLNLNPNQLTFEKTQGNQNPSKWVYWISLNDKGNGFFALFNRMLRYLAYADYYHLTPLITYGNEGLNVDPNMAGNNTVFDYYFNQPSNIDVNRLTEQKHLIKSRYVDSQMLFESIQDNVEYLLTEKEILRLGKVFKQYVTFNDETQKRLDSKHLNVLSDQRILGVHIRGTDFRNINKHHPKFIDEQTYFDVIDPALESKQYDGVFLATDDVDLLESFKSRYTDKLYYHQDVFRSDKKENLASQDAQRTKHQYLSGLEVLLDVYTLAHCHGLVAGLSQVSLAARIMNVALAKPYQDTTILSKGFHR